MRLEIVLLCGLLGGLAGAARGASDPPRCPGAAATASEAPTLRNTQAALRAGGRFDVLAIGSGSMVGPLPGGDRASFPYQMIEALRADWPSVELRLAVRGGRGVGAAEMLGDIRQELAHGHFPLVIWQTGTVEAMRGVSLDDFYRTLSAGAAAAQTAGSDLVLVDPPYSRALRHNADLAPYEGVLSRAAQLPGVTLFRRYDLMRLWAEADGLDLERTPKSDRAAMLDKLHACLGQALARWLQHGAAPAKAPT